MNQSEIPEAIINPETNEEIRKNVFVIFAHGKEIIAKIQKDIRVIGCGSCTMLMRMASFEETRFTKSTFGSSDLASVLRNTKNTLDAELNAIARGHWLHG